MVKTTNRLLEKTNLKKLLELKEEQFYYLVQEILFSEIIQDSLVIANALKKNHGQMIYLFKDHIIKNFGKTIMYY